MIKQLTQNEKSQMRKSCISFVTLFISILFFVNGFLLSTKYKTLPKESAYLQSGYNLESIKKPEYHKIETQIIYNKEQDITVKTNLHYSDNADKKIANLLIKTAKKQNIKYKQIVILDRDNHLIYLVNSKK